jgi:hypothetical protein
MEDDIDSKLRDARHLKKAGLAKSMAANIAKWNEGARAFEICTGPTPEMTWLVQPYNPTRRTVAST